MSGIRDILETSVEGVLGRGVTPALLRDAEQGQWPAELWSAVEDAGLTHAAIHEESGGAGATWSEIFALVRSAGRHGPPIPLVETVVGGWLLSVAGLPSVLGPVAIAAAPDIEWESGGFSANLSGVAWGAACEHLVVLAGRVSPRVVLFARSDFTAVGAANIAGEPRDDLRLSDAQPTATGDWPHDPDALLMTGAMVRSAQIAGAIERVLEQATQYANERVQFGRPIGQFQAVQQTLAQLATQALLASAAAEHAFNTADARLSPFAVATAKICTSELAGLAASAAHAVFGAIGITHEHSLHFTTRRLWSWRAEFGGQSFWSERLGRQACAGGSTGLWPAVTHGDFSTTVTA
ncbi:MAG: acyl-CoA dehydrogenase family protein [Caulobacter sp.]|nr:acyl-CoA dehydrogenase family protein [Caulobacter sp.]